jgi:hypothetical protein
MSTFMLINNVIWARTFIQLSFTFVFVGLVGSKELFCSVASSTKEENVCEST